MTSRNSFLWISALMVILLFVVGCSDSTGNPVTPGQDESVQDLTGSAETHTAAGTGIRAMWGFYEVLVDTESGEIEIVPNRNASFRFNVNKFLQPPAGNPADLSIAIHDASTFLTDGRIAVDVTITHPFPLTPTLTGFDVMGVFMTDGSTGGYMDPSVNYTAGSPAEPELLNADGYTRWMNAIEFTQTGLLGYTHGNKGIPGFIPGATLNSYKYYSEFLGVDESLHDFFQTQQNVDARGSFLSGSSLTRRYAIRFPIVGGSPQLRFNYAILTSWAAAGIPNPGINDFPPQANQQEPIQLSVTDNGSDLYYIDSFNNGGNLRLQVEIFDWQGAANPSGVAGELSSLIVEDPNGNVIPGGWIDVLPSATVTTGAANSEIFTFEINYCTPQGSGRQDFLVTAESISPTDYDNGLGAPYPASALLSAYALHTATVFNYNPCPTPSVTSLQYPIVTLNSVHNAYQIGGTNFSSGTQAATEFRRSSGDIAGTHVTINNATSAQADFDFNGFAAGTYDMWFKNGCGMEAALSTAIFEINTPPQSTGITGPANGDGNLIGNYVSNATDVDTDPVDTLTMTWEVWDMTAMIKLIGPVTGDPFNLPFLNLPIGPHEVRCNVSDGFAPDDLSLTFPFTRINTQPTIADPTGPAPVWDYSIFTYSVVANDLDAGQTLTYMWSFEAQGNPPVYTYAGDPTPGDVTIAFKSMPAFTVPGYYELDCQVDDGSGVPNATATCNNPLLIYVAGPPYTSGIPPTMFNQIVTPGIPSLQGIIGCPSFWNNFYGPGIPLQDPDICVLSGPSLGMPGVMVLADEVGALVAIPPPPPVTMAFAHFTCPFTSGAPPAWWWWTAGQFPAGAGMAPSAVRFDGNINAEILVTNSMMTNMLAGWGIPDPSAFELYAPAGIGKVCDLFTSLNPAGAPDVAVDASAGFDMGSPSSPDNPPLYGLFTQDNVALLLSCGGPMPGVPAPMPVHIVEFPSGGVQPVGVAVDAGGPGIVAPLPFGFTGVGPGLLNITGGGPCPAGIPLPFPEPYYALAIDDDDADNPWPTGLPTPVTRRVIAAIIDGDRDVEIFEIDFGAAPPPGPAPINLLATIAMGSYFGGNPNAYAVDCEFISNFSGMGGTVKPVWPDDLLAVLLTDPIGGIWVVEVFQLTPPGAISVGISMPIPTPPGIWMSPGVAFRLDVDEVTGDIYVVHEDTLGSGSVTVTIIPY